ncbi:hypothetical protein QBC32DRAFT_366842 [Pseudoneurospora amorphoporcata]|uniref:BZIP domain-containing protein n=1 Tax=Pseudoneurospora amorphoporcata TaxID=241081 RepID=A0AAN6SKL3_9PEZI|nr:hypothetical protein QBC32DRAFT_366842 [Pseudoneurospora amorphoporcata]
MSTDLRSHTSIPRRSSTSLSAFPLGTTSATRPAASSTIALDHDHEYLKGASGGVPLQSVWGVVAEKKQRFGAQPRVTRSALTYSRRRSLSETVKKVNKGKGLRKKLVKALCHDSRITVEVVGEHTQPEHFEPIEVEHEDLSTIVCAIDTRLESNTIDNKVTTNPLSPTSELAEFNSTQPNKMCSRSARHSSSRSSSSAPFSTSKEKHLSSPPSRSQTSRPPNSTRSKSKTPPPPTTPSSKTDRTGKMDKDNKDDWHQIHEPEQRRRIQNRIAQRKFREKARTLKDQAARDAQNRRYAGCAYTCPSVDDLPLEHEIYRAAESYYLDEEGAGDGGMADGGFGGRGARRGEAAGEPLGGECVGGEGVLSGLPWGGLSMRFVVGRGHEYYRYQTSRGSVSGSGTGTVTSLSPTITALGTPTPLPTGTSGGDTWPTLQHSQAATYCRHTTSGGSAGSPLSPYGMMMPMGMNLMGNGDMDMDVDYAMAGTGAGGQYVTSPPVSLSGVILGTGTGTGMDVTYYDSSPYYTTRQAAVDAVSMEVVEEDGCDWR